jgi:hypothetical protein
MSLLPTTVRLLAVAAAAVFAFQAHAGNRFGGSSADLVPGGSTLAPTYIDVNLTGFQTYGDFGDPLNSQVFLSIAPGSTITGFDYLNLAFQTNGFSYLNEFVLSVNNSEGSEYLDAAPSDIGDSGSFGPESGSWATALGGMDGGPFTVANGVVWVTAYELFTDEGLNATVTGGTLRIYYDSPSPVPEPGTYGLMGLGLLGVAGAVRRRMK